MEQSASTALWCKRNSHRHHQTSWCVNNFAPKDKQKIWFLGNIRKYFSSLFSPQIIVGVCLLVGGMFMLMIGEIHWTLIWIDIQYSGWGGLYFIFLQASSCRWSGWTRKCRGYLESKHQKTQKTLLPWLAPSKDTNEINEFTKCSGCSLPLSVYWSIFFAKKKNYVDLDFSRNASTSRGRMWMWTLCLCRRITSLGGHQLGNRLRYFSSVCRPQCNILFLFAVQNAIF